MKTVFITDANHQELKRNSFHQKVLGTDYVRGERGIVIEDTSFYLYASMHMDGNTDFRLVDTHVADMKKLEINIVLDEVEEEEEEELDDEEIVKLAISEAIDKFYSVLGDHTMEYDINPEEVLKTFHTALVDELF